MDKFAYKVSMSIEAILLVILMSTFYLTSMIGVEEVPVLVELCNSTLFDNVTTAASATAATSLTDCAPGGIEAPTSITTKVVFAIWVWAIYFTFPGTYSTQVTDAIQGAGCHKKCPKSVGISF